MLNTSSARGVAKGGMQSFKILHRIYFDDMPPYKDPFKRFLDSWLREMPDYKIMYWNASNLDLNANQWVKRATQAKSPVFLSEFFRWKVLSQFGGIYLDADCEVLDGRTLDRIAQEVFVSTEFDAALGVEDYYNGHPTAQTVIARPNSKLVQFMVRMYDEYLSGPLWHWRELRGFIGPQLISLYFMEHGVTATKGMIVQLDQPKTYAGVKVYPQEYFSPKFEIDGKTLRYTQNTCVYHLFANLNMPWTDAEKERSRMEPLLFSEYLSLINSIKTIHRIYFGFDGKPDTCLDYLQTWVQQMPGYQIRHWNADNLPMDANDYVKDLYAARDHAFLTDYFRWWVLREHGGVYFDADIEVVDGAAFNRYVEELNEAKDFDAFIGVDNKRSGWYTAHSMAARKGAEITKYMCRVYEELGPIRAWRKRAFYLWAPQLTALYFSANHHHEAGMGTTPHLDYPVVHAGVKIYPQDYFSPITPESSAEGDLFSIDGFTERTALCHHFACSWHTKDSIYSSHAEKFSERRNVLLRELVERNRVAHESLVSPSEPADVIFSAADFGPAGAIEKAPHGQDGTFLPARIWKWLHDYFVSNDQHTTDDWNDRVRDFIAKGDVARDTLDWGTAQLMYASAVKLDPSLEAIFVQLGHAQKEFGRYAEAEVSYKQALALNNRNSDTYLQLGHLFKMSGRLPDAVAMYKRACELDPSCKDASRELRTIQQQRILAVTGGAGSEHVSA